MNPDDFPRLLAHGFGRIVVFLRACGDARPWRETILDACFHDQRFDRQCENERGPYLFHVVAATGEPDFYAARLRERLRAPHDEDDLDQMFGLAAEFARRGDEATRETMYAVFETNIRCEADPTGAFALIELDGVAGFVFVARRLAACALADGDDWYPEHALFVLEDVLGKDEAAATLDEIIAAEPEIASFLTRLKNERAATRAQAAEYRQQIAAPLSYEELQRRLAAPGMGALGPTRRRMANADDALIERLARELLEETERERLLKYLRLFRWRAFPLEPTRLIAFARDDLDTWLATNSVNALAQITHLAVRAFALELLEGARPWDGARLLVRNYAEDDLPLLARAAERDLPPVEYHWLGMGIFDCFEANPTPNAATTLRMLYERGPCSMCRKRFVKLLREIEGPLPDWLIHECLFDAHESLRKLAKSEEEAGRVSANRNANAT